MLTGSSNPELLEHMQEMISSTYSPSVFLDRNKDQYFLPELSGMEQPVIVSSGCGVGPKLRIASVMQDHEPVGRDCVAMCINDLLCVGAKPMFFSAYTAGDKHDEERLVQIVSGVTSACREAGCAFFGGDRVEKQGVYADGKYDLAGFALGVVDKKRMVDGSSIRPGDLLLGLASSGLHNNGFDIVREVFEINVRSLSRHFPELSCSLGDELLKPSAIYARSVLYLTQTMNVTVKGLSHIAEGGLFGSLTKMLPEGVCACVTPSTFPIPAIFDLISQRGNISLENMFRDFNMGTGFVIAVSREDAGPVYNALIQTGEHPYVAGYCVEGERGVELVW